MEDNINVLSVGDKLIQFIGKQDGYQLEYNNNAGFILFALFRNPTNAEIKEFTKMHYFTLTYSEFYNVSFFGIKVGRLPWGDCPFSPIIYPDPIVFPQLNENEGLAMNVILVDTYNGEIKAIRTVGLRHDFSEKIIQYLSDDKKTKLTMKKYKDVVANVYRHRSSMDIAVAALTKTSIHGK